jgi:hypothetical protein
MEAKVANPTTRLAVGLFYTCGLLAVARAVRTVDWIALQRLNVEGALTLRLLSHYTD